MSYVLILCFQNFSSLLYYLCLSDESISTDNVQGGNAKDPVWIVDTSLLQDLRGNGDCAVYRVGDNADLKSHA